MSAAKADGSAAGANEVAEEANASATKANEVAEEANASATKANEVATEANASATEANRKILTSNALSGHPSNMSEPAKRIATHADIEALPPNLVGEIVDGELYITPRPPPRHGYAQTSLGAWVSRHFGHLEGEAAVFWILPEVEVHLEQDVLVPDLGGWRRETMPVLPNEAYMRAPPSWICEILRPSTQALERVTKMKAYARYGVNYAWLLDPLARSLEAFQWVEGRWTVIALHEGNERVRVAPFEAVELPLEMLWVD